MAKSPVKTTTNKRSNKKNTTTSRAKKTGNTSSEARHKEIEITAYYIAQKDDFRGNAIDYWVIAEEKLNK